MPMHFHLPRVQSFTNVMDQVRDVMKHYKHEKESEAHRVCVLVSALIILSADRPSDLPAVGRTQGEGRFASDH